MECSGRTKADKRCQGAPTPPQNPREDRGSHISPVPLNHICFQCSSFLKHLDVSASLPLKTWLPRALERVRWFPRSCREHTAERSVNVRDFPGWSLLLFNPPRLPYSILCSWVHLNNSPIPPPLRLPLRCSPLQLFTLTCSPVQPRLFFYSTSLTVPGETCLSILLFNHDSRTFFCSNAPILFPSLTCPPVPTPPSFSSNLFSYTGQPVPTM